MKKLILLSTLTILGISIHAQNAGSLDLSFDSADGCDGVVNAVTFQPDGKIIVSGDFGFYDGVVAHSIIRLNTDGTLDESFNSGAGATYSGAPASINSAAVQPDGKIIVGGNFNSFDGTAMNSIARLNADGSFDGSFSIGTGPNYPVFTAVILPNGKILIGGSFTSYDGTSTGHLARLNADGSLDGSFDLGTGANDNINAIALQPDGKIIIAGGSFFSSYDGTPVKRIARLNMDGTLDGSFDTGTGADSDVQSVAIQPDGKIVIGGAFSSYDGTASNNIARINADGSLDDTFEVGTGVDGNWVFDVALQPDGKIIVAGWFDSYDGTYITNLARLNADGTIDESFDIGNGPDNWIYATAVQSDGNILIGGRFTSYDGTDRGYIARLYGAEPSGVEDITLSGSYIFPNPSSGLYNLVLNKVSGTVQLTIADITGRELQSEQYTASGSTSHSIDLSGHAKGVYSLFVHTAQGTDRLKLVKD